MDSWSVDYLEDEDAVALLCDAIDSAFQGSVRTGLSLSAQLRKDPQTSELILSLVDHCAGLPLALSVVGGVVGKEDKVDSAIDTARALMDGARLAGETKQEKLEATLKSSINRLEPADRRAFLDVVWFYAPAELPWSLVEAVLDAPDGATPTRSQKKVLRSLHSRSLVDRRQRPPDYFGRNRDDCVGVHAQLLMVALTLINDSCFTEHKYLVIDNEAQHLASINAASYRGIALDVSGFASLDPSNMHDFLLAKRPEASALHVLVVQDEEQAIKSIPSIAHSYLKVLWLRCKVIWAPLAPYDTD